MKLVHVVRTSSFAGVERYVSVLAASQAARGDDVTIVGGLRPAMLDTVGPFGVRHLEAGSMPHAIRALTSLEDPDIVHVHMTEAETVAVMADWRRRRPIVATRHFAAVRGRTVLGGLARPVIARRVAAQIAVSEYVASRVDGRSTVVYPGVASRPPVDPAGRRRTILMAQRLEPEKDSAVGLEAFARSGLAEDGWTLDLAGDGSLRDVLEARCRHLGLGDAARFRGFVADMDSALSTCGVLLAPPKGEHFGLTVLEAMSWGTPIVAAASGGHLETVGAMSDVGLFEPGDVDGAAKALRTLAADEGLRREYGAALRAGQQSRFTLEAQADGVEAVYRSVL